MDAHDTRHLPLRSPYEVDLVKLALHQAAVAAETRGEDELRRDLLTVYDRLRGVEAEGASAG